MPYVRTLLRGVSFEFCRTMLGMCVFGVQKAKSYASLRPKLLIMMYGGCLKLVVYPQNKDYSVLGPPAIYGNYRIGIVRIALSHVHVATLRRTWSTQKLMFTCLASGGIPRWKKGLEAMSWLVEESAGGWQGSS